MTTSVRDNERVDLCDDDLDTLEDFLVDMSEE